MQPSNLAKRGSLLLFLGLIAFYFYGLGLLPLLGPDEPRYAQVAREMFLRGDLITPTLGGHLWVEKPSLLYWLIFASYKLFGVSEWSARLGPAVCGLLTITAVFWVGKRVERATPDGELAGHGLWSALAAGTSVGLVAFSLAASFDIVLTMTTTWALAFFVVAELDETPKRRLWLAGFYAAIGLSLLAKGLVGLVVPFGVVSVYYLLRGRRPERSIYSSLLWGLPLALAIAATWYGPMIWKHGSPFINRFIVEHHFARYVSNKYHHRQPFYFYLLIVPAFALPWTAFLFEGIWTSRRVPRRVDDPGSKVRVFLIAWVFVPLIFFSFASSKLPGYILPVLPAAALIAGERLARFTSGVTNTVWPARATAILFLLFAIAAPIYAMNSGAVSVQSALAIAIPLTMAGAFALISQRSRTAAILLMAVAILVALVIAVRFIAPQTVARESSKQLLQLASERGYSQSLIYGMQRDDRTPEFYAPGRVVYGNDGEPVMYEGLWPVVLESRRRNAPLLVFLPVSDLLYLRNLNSATADVIGNNGRIALVAVRAF